MDSKRIPSSADIAKTAKPKAGSPTEAIHLLIEGNTRFYSGNSQGATTSAFERRMQIVQQAPFAVVLGCSDSRVPIEIVFDQGLGDLFVVRVAGNVADKGVMGTIEFAVEYLNIKAIVVLGHEGCGAVQAVIEPTQKDGEETPMLTRLLAQISPAMADLAPIRDEKARMREAVVANVRHQMSRLHENPVIRTAVEEERIAVAGAYYEIGSGAVDFIDPSLGKVQ